MQISRHWRMNSQRYRLEGVRYENGEIALQARPIRQSLQQLPHSETEELEVNGNKPPDQETSLVLGLTPEPISSVNHRERR